MPHATTSPNWSAQVHRHLPELDDSGYGGIWQRARPLALTLAQQTSPLARRRSDLRHAGVSLWLNAGVPATEVTAVPGTVSLYC
ncbi:MAG: hypothetical protein ACLPN6_04650 [Streptosporangiaceae bacterium]|jgi:hypothetical protein